jgi:hypothetical protein
MVARSLVERKIVGTWVGDGLEDSWAFREEQSLWRGPGEKFKGKGQYQRTPFSEPTLLMLSEAARMRLYKRESFGH